MHVTIGGYLESLISIVFECHGLETMQMRERNLSSLEILVSEGGECTYHVCPANEFFVRHLSNVFRTPAVRFPNEIFVEHVFREPLRF